MPESARSLREELAVATRILARHGLIGMFGHVSVLTDDPQRYLVCPGAVPSPRSVAFWRKR
jgi:ribulose-5-phosphate 4-epimerase/fuculose-1-phosphate aldolase